MRHDLTIALTKDDRARLEQLVADRNQPSKVVWRARIVLATADGLGTMAIMRTTGKSKPCVWRWQERFVAEGIDGLLRDKTRLPGTAPLSSKTRLAVLAKTATDADQRHALERAHDGQSDWHRPHERPAHLGRSRFKAASDPHIQGLQRPAV